jgi:hypothetical protein
MYLSGLHLTPLSANLIVQNAFNPARETYLPLFETVKLFRLWP